MSGLYSGCGEAAGGGGVFDKEIVEECNKQGEEDEQIGHESRGKVQALSFCQ